MFLGSVWISNLSGRRSTFNPTSHPASAPFVPPPVRPRSCPIVTAPRSSWRRPPRFSQLGDVSACRAKHVGLGGCPPDEIPSLPRNRLIMNKKNFFGTRCLAVRRIAIQLGSCHQRPLIRCSSRPGCGHMMLCQLTSPRFRSCADVGIATSRPGRLKQEQAQAV